MNRFRRLFFVVIVKMCFLASVYAQAGTDTTNAGRADSLQKTDSLTGINTADSTFHRINNSVALSKKPLANPPVVIRKYNGRELLFYVLVVLVLIFALLRNAFPKYFNDLFRLFFRTTMKQRQIREQLIQTPLPSLLLNGYFVITGGLYIDFLLQHYEFMPVKNFWLLFLYCVLALSIIYFVKFLGLKLSGWLFNMKEAADAYIFIVFVVNKIIGIFLLPFLVALAFMEGEGHSVAIVLSWVGIAGLILYRLILTYAAVRNQVRVNPFHFFLYLCAFEVAPLLLIYKGLLVYLKQTA